VASRRPVDSDAHAPVAQGIERCPAEAEAARSNRAGRMASTKPFPTWPKARNPHDQYESSLRRIRRAARRLEIARQGNGSSGSRESSGSGICDVVDSSEWAQNSVNPTGVPGNRRVASQSRRPMCVCGAVAHAALAFTPRERRAGVQRVSGLVSWSEKPERRMAGRVACRRDCDDDPVGLGIGERLDDGPVVDVLDKSAEVQSLAEQLGIQVGGDP
jgi:hypothetical protein